MKSFGKSVVMFILLCAIFISESSGQLQSGTRERIFHSTVLIEAAVQLQLETAKGVVDTLLYWSGSGNVISPCGWILTNAHVAYFDPTFGDQSLVDYFPEDYYMPDQLLVCYTSDPELPPQPVYYADIVEGYYRYRDPDIALIKCNWRMDGSVIPLDEEIFTEYHYLGDSDDLEHGDELYCIGYPDYAAGGISYTSGEVTNILADADRFGYTERYFIGTDASISGGNSGGAAVNRDGKLIGLPTMGLSGSAGWRGYITPINKARWMLGTWVEETGLGASVNGRVVSEQTGQGVIGADVYILYPEVSVDAFMELWRRDRLTDEEYAALVYAVFAYCKSGIDGRFCLEHLLPSGYEYSVIVSANSYEDMAAQDFLDISNANDRNITLELVRY
ncbi:MAG: trypsin-like peptidase domain-containing protein [Candidatus Fermentibacteraceae bacterium]|nr:trypsin-like peptidase domain-containing protein [Candidatus Fermentibacteraceae bacterium]MBN2607902.1 trypsin-like peptidase domain-containing protein [Candidatus Fermentibacteraceae bacterium]